MERRALCDVYADYLRRGARPEHARLLSEALAEVAPSMGEALVAYGAAGPGSYVARTSEHAGKRIHVGPALPVGEPGALWFDTAELSTMMLLHFYVDPAERDELSAELVARLAAQTTWFATRPVTKFQYAAFLDVVGHTPARGFAISDPVAPVTAITCDDAYAYLEYFGKSLPGDVDRHAAAELGLAAWSLPAREWTGSTFPDAYAVAVTPATLDVDPEETEDETDPERRMQYAWDEAPANVTFRSAVHTMYGLRRVRPSAFVRE